MVVFRDPPPAHTHTRAHMHTRRLLLPAAVPPVFSQATLPPGAMHPGSHSRARGHRVEGVELEGHRGRRPAFLLGPEGQGLWLRRPCVWFPEARPSRRVSPSGSRLQQSICEGLWRQHALQGSQKRVSVHQGGTVSMLPGLVPSPGPWPEHPGACGPTSTPAPAAQGGSYAH